MLVVGVLISSDLYKNHIELGPEKLYICSGSISDNTFETAFLSNKSSLKIRILDLSKCVIVDRFL